MLVKLASLYPFRVCFCIHAIVFVSIRLSVYVCGCQFVHALMLSKKRIHAQCAVNQFHTLGSDTGLIQPRVLGGLLHKSSP